MPNSIGVLVEMDDQIDFSFAKVSNLNCIDLSNLDRHNSVSLLKQACLHSGFFYLINHGISQEFMDEVFAQCRKFFNLPMCEKMKLLRNEKHRGYTPVFDEALDPENQVKGDYKEGYYIGVEVAEDDPKSQKPFYGKNVWPASDLLTGWRQTMEKYHLQALEVARQVARIIALALDLDVNFFDKPEMLGEPIANLRLLHYEGQASDPSRGIFGSGAHTDYGLITLLATDDVMGLQICKDKDAKPQIWEYIAPLKGAFIVNLGDMLERWSNCIFRSTLHRVIGNGQQRYSSLDVKIVGVTPFVVFYLRTYERSGHGLLEMSENTSLRSLSKRTRTSWRSYVREVAEDMDDNSESLGVDSLSP